MRGMPSSATTVIDSESTSKSAYRSGEAFTMRQNCFSPEAMAILGRTTSLTVNTRVGSPVAAPHCMVQVAQRVSEFLMKSYQAQVQRLEGLESSPSSSRSRESIVPSHRLRSRPTCHRDPADNSRHEDVCGADKSLNGLAIQIRGPND